MKLENKIFKIKFFYYKLMIKGIFFILTFNSNKAVMDQENLQKKLFKNILLYIHLLLSI